jgi:hypothetical protein
MPMENGRQSQHPATMEPREPWDGDGLTREPLPPEPQSPWSSWALPQATGMRMLLGALAVLLVVTVVGTTALVLRDLGMQRTSTPVMQAAPTATATLLSGTPTPDLRDPKNNGWTQVTIGPFDSMAFAPSSPQRGYLCSQDDTTNAHIFGLTTDSGLTWKMSASPHAYYTCQIQISPTSSLDVALTSYLAPNSGPPPVDAHFTTDGGKTWKAAPFPQNTVAPAGSLWAGSYLYLWAGPNKDNGQQGFLKVSANGGSFTAVDPTTLFPSGHNVSIGGAIAVGNKVYLNLGYNGCSAQNCWGIVASSDGGQTWAQVPNKSNIWIAGAVGGTLYGTVVDGPTATPVLSTDNGATWSTQTLPQLPDGHDAGLCVPAADDTCYMPSGLGVAYLHGGSWTVVPFSTDQKGFVDHVTVSLNASGHAQRVWVSCDCRWSGIYGHALP